MEKECCSYKVKIFRDGYKSVDAVRIAVQDLAISETLVNGEIIQTKEGYALSGIMQCSAIKDVEGCYGVCLKQTLEASGISEVPVGPCLQTNQGGDGK